MGLKQAWKAAELVMAVSLLKKVGDTAGTQIENRPQVPSNLKLESLVQQKYMLSRVFFQCLQIASFFFILCTHTSKSIDLSSESLSSIAEQSLNPHRLFGDYSPFPTQKL